MLDGKILIDVTNRLNLENPPAAIDGTSNAEQIQALAPSARVMGSSRCTRPLQHVVNAREADPVAALRELNGGRGIDYVLEASGVPSVLRQAIAVLVPLGTCGIVGAPAPDVEVGFNAPEAIVKGSKIIGINQGDAVPRNSIPALAELHRQGRFPFNELVRLYPFGDIEQAARDAAAGTVIEPVLRMPSA